MISQTKSVFCVCVCVCTEDELFNIQVKYLANCEM